MRFSFFEYVAIAIMIVGFVLVYKGVAKGETMPPPAAQQAASLQSDDMP